MTAIISIDKYSDGDDDDDGGGDWIVVHIIRIEFKDDYINDAFRKTVTSVNILVEF